MDQNLKYIVSVLYHLLTESQSRFRNSDILFLRTLT